MDALQEAGIRLHEHVARCQIRHRGIKLDNPIPFSLRTVTGEAIVLIELFASREIALTRGGVGCRSHKPTGRRQHAKDREARAFHDIPFLFWSCKHPANDRIPASAEHIPEATRPSDRAAPRPLDWQPARRHRHSRSVQALSLQKSEFLQWSIV